MKFTFVIMALLQFAVVASLVCEMLRFHSATWESSPICEQKCSKLVENPIALLEADQSSHRLDYCEPDCHAMKNIQSRTKEVCRSWLLLHSYPAYRKRVQRAKGLPVWQGLKRISSHGMLRFPADIIYAFSPFPFWQSFVYLNTFIYCVHKPSA